MADYQPSCGQLSSEGRPASRDPFGFEAGILYFCYAKHSLEYFARVLAMKRCRTDRLRGRARQMYRRRRDRERTRLGVIDVREDAASPELRIIQHL